MSESVLQEKIQHFTDAVNKSLENKNWYSALALTFTLPDICSKLERPRIGTNTRYPVWFDNYVTGFYTIEVGPNKEEKIFLNGNDAYSLRCSFLHQGESNIKDQKARRELEGFKFVAPIEGWFIHNNKVNNTLQLQVDKFCFDILTGVEEWLEENKENEALINRAKDIMEIEHLI